MSPAHGARPVTGHIVPRMCAMPDDPDVQKRALRAELRERRQNLPRSERELATEGFTRAARGARRLDRRASRSRATSRCRPSPNTRAVRERAEARGIRVLFPVTRADGLLDWTVGDGRDRDRRGPVRHARAGRRAARPDRRSTTSTSSSSRPPRSTAPACGWAGDAATSTRPSARWRAARPVYAVVFDCEFVDAGAARSPRPAPSTASSRRRASSRSDRR